MSIRAVTGSALDALADGPQAKHLGLTRRLHDVVERYDAVVSAERHAMNVYELGVFSDVWVKLGYPSIRRPELRPELAALILAADSGLFKTARRVLDSSPAALAAMVERAEEHIAARAADRACNTVPT